MVQCRIWETMKHRNKSCIFHSFSSNIYSWFSEKSRVYFFSRFIFQPPGIAYFSICGVQSENIRLSLHSKWVSATNLDADFLEICNLFSESKHYDPESCLRRQSWSPDNILEYLQLVKQVLPPHSVSRDTGKWSLSCMGMWTKHCNTMIMSGYSHCPVKVPVRWIIYSNGKRNSSEESFRLSPIWPGIITTSWSHTLLSAFS